MIDRHKRVCACCGCLNNSDDVWHVCPVCFWGECSSERFSDEPSDDNLTLTPEQARENYKEFGAFDRSALPYVRRPLPFEITEKTLETKGYPPDREEKLWFDELPKEMPEKDFIIVLLLSENAFGARCYLKNDEYARLDYSWMKPENTSLFDRYRKHFLIMRRTPGNHILEYKDGKLVDHEVFDQCVPGNDEASLLYNKYGLLPDTEHYRNCLLKRLKEDKDKLGSLEYACECSDTRLILERLEKITPAEVEYLNEDFDECDWSVSCSLLETVAKNGNFPAYRALCESKKLGLKTKQKFFGLENAFDTSTDIVLYLYDLDPEQFRNETRSGFRSIAATSCTNLRTLERLRDIGWKISDSRYNDPPLHLFIEKNNSVGVQFLYDSGVDLANELNIYGTDALTEAEDTGNINEAYELLRFLIKMQNK